MKRIKNYIFFLFIAISACSQQKQNNVSQGLFAGHYNLNKPQVFNMPKELDEISGIAFHHDEPNIIYAEQDEDGKVFTFDFKNNITKTKFGNKGDYEDIQIMNNFVVMLRSDGSLFTFPLSDMNQKESSNTKEFIHILPSGEYEGLYADNTSSKLYVMCKHCSEKQDKITSVYILSVDENGEVKLESNTTINIKSIAEKMGAKKIVFHPSALLKNEHTNEWFILSSVNKIIVRTSNDFTAEEVYKLDPSIYNQPEGIALDKDQNLYISNEKGTTKSATILKIPFSK